MTTTPQNDAAAHPVGLLLHETELDFIATDAIERLANAIHALRMAIDAGDRVPGYLGQSPSGNGDPAEAHKLAIRCRAAMLLISTAMDVVESAGTSAFKAMNTLILDWCTKP